MSSASKIRPLRAKMANNDVAIRVEETLAIPNHAQMPNVGNLNINKSTVHVGPKFVTVTQNVQNAEMVKGKCLCFDLISGHSYGGLRCAVAVFVCWSLIVATGLSVYFIYIVLPSQRTRLDLELSLPKYLWDIVKNSSRTERVSCAAAAVAVIVCITLIVYFTTRPMDTDETVDTPPHEWNITRQMWLAQPYNNTERTTKFDPLFIVIVQHSVSNECRRFVSCAAELRNLQSYFIHAKEYDIPYNFLIGNDGRVYEGRGWGVVGAHTHRYNRCSLGLGFIGDYREEITPFTRVTEGQLNRTHMLLEEGVRLGYLRPDYQIVGAKDLQATASPGSNLYNALRQWPNYDHQNRFKDLNCEQIYEKYRNVHL